MDDPGTTNNHANGYDWTSDSQFDSLTKVSWACKVHRKAAATTTSLGNFIFGTDDPSSGGFRFDTNASFEMRAQVHNGAGGSNSATVTGALPTDTTVSAVARHDGDANLLKIAIQEIGTGENVSATNDPGATSEVAICDHDDRPGAPVAVGQCMIWPNYILTDDEVEEYHAGLVVPAAAKLAWWCRCIAEPNVELVGAGNGTEQGTITLFSDAVDGMFAGQGFLAPHRQLAGYNIRILACSPELYVFRVPAEFAAVALGDEILVSDGDLPAASSLLTSLNEHFMLDDWRSMNAIVLGADIQDNLEISFTVLNRLPSMCLVWESGALDKGSLVNAEEQGTASVVPWATMTNSRNSQHFIIDSTDDSSRVRLASVPRFSTKINHRGSLYEPAVTNLVINSAFLVDGAGPPTFSGWTETLGTGGTVSAVDSTTVPMLFADESIQGNTVQVCEIVKGSAGDVHISRTLAIDTSGDDMIVAIWHRGLAANLQLQRSSDSQYWSGATTWTGTDTWQSLSASSDEWLRTIFRVGGMPTSGNITIRIGFDSATGLENDDLFVGQVMAYQYWAIASDIVTLGSAETSEADDDVWDLDNGGTHSAQTFNPNRGTVRVRYRWETDSADVPNSTIMTLAVFGVGASDYDHLFIERTSGGTLQIGFERVISGVQDAVATKALSAYSIGNEFEAAGRWTDTRGVELGLSARTLSVFEDGTKGTDDQATGIHSTSDQTTFRRWGNPHSGIVGTVIPAAGYVKNRELVQWAIPDEGINARRVAA